MSTDTKSTFRYQANLLSQIYGNSVELLDPGLKIYQNNLRMTATRSLAISYPVINKMVGDQALYVLAKRLLDSEPPQTGDWADWGKGLVEILKQSELHKNHPYLSQMAELEWAFQVASRGAVEDLDVDSLTLLNEEDVEEVMVILQSSISIITSNFPLGSLWRLHRYGDTHQIPTKDQILEAMNSSESGFYLIWQSVAGPKVVAITEDCFFWMKAVQSGLRIGKLLDEFPEHNFSVWLSDSIRNRWLVCLER